jgi:hypothetical protein
LKYTYNFWAYWSSRKDIISVYKKARFETIILLSLDITENMTAGNDGVEGFAGEVMRTEQGMNDHELTDDILWSDCTEELYLQQILREHHQDEGTITDSIMGQSTVAGIFSSKKEDHSSKVGGSDGRSWTNFAPIARSVATEGTISVESSPSFVDSAGGTTIAFSGPRFWDTARRNQEPSKAVGEDPVPVRMNPRFLNFDEESFTSTLPERHRPGMVEMEDPYDQEAPECSTIAGLSTLSGDTIRRFVQPEMHYARAWIDAGQITFAKPDVTGTTKSSKQSQPRRDIRRRSTEESREGCFSRVLRRVTEDDKVFRRTVAISVLFIFLFVSLSAVALVRTAGRGITPAVAIPSTQVSEPTSSPSPLSAPVSGQQSQPLADLAPTGTPSAPPASLQPPNQEEMVADPFRFVADLINQQSPSSTRALGKQQSPQYRALRWSADDLQSSPSLSEERILQRWTLAVLFFGLGGEDWVSRGGWLTTANECLWFSTSDESICDELGRLVRLGLEGNNLQGSVPDELGLLSDSLTEVNVSKNQISGSIPTRIGLLASLRHLSMRQNALTGSIPVELTKLISLSKFCRQLLSSNE